MYIQTRVSRIQDFAAAERQIRFYMRRDLGSAKATFESFDVNK